MKRSFLKKDNVIHAKLSFSSHKGIDMVKTIHSLLEIFCISQFAYISEIKRRKRKSHSYKLLTVFFKIRHMVTDKHFIPSQYEMEVKKAEIHHVFGRPSKADILKDTLISLSYEERLREL